jgi:hypothetical protein
VSAAKAATRRYVLWLRTDPEHMRLPHDPPNSHDSRKQRRRERENQQQPCPYMPCLKRHASLLCDGQMAFHCHDSTHVNASS